MKVTSDRIRVRAEQLRTQGYTLHTNMVRATLELNAGARTRLIGDEKTPPAPPTATDSNAGCERHQKNAA